MRINRVNIRNFRCLSDVDIPFDQVTTFMGPNGTGKSTVLRALDWFFNGTKTGPLQDGDCTHGSESKEIRVEVEFTDLSEADRRELGHYAPQDNDKILIWKIRSASGEERMSANAKAYPPFSTIRMIDGKNALKDAYNQLCAGDSSLSLSRASSGQQALDNMQAWEAQHADRLEDAPEEVQTDFFGFNSKGKLSGLFDYVFVTADLRADEELVDSKTTIIGRILERAVDRTAADAALATLGDQVARQQQIIYEQNFRTQLTTISTELTSAVAQFTSGRSVAVRNQPVDLKPQRTQFSVSIIDEGLETAINRQGHGFQRTLLIAALQLLAKRGSAAAGDGVICLAVEEPELFQHPVQAQAFATILRRLAEDPQQKIQVAYATHSPYFISSGHFEQVRRLSKDVVNEGDTVPTTTVHSTSVDAVIARLAGYKKESEIRNRLDSVALYRLPDALFASTAVLVEGTSDRAILEGMNERAGQVPLAIDGIVVADVGGKADMYLPHAILSELGIPVYVLFDADNGLEARMRSNGKAEQTIKDAVAANKRYNEQLIKYLGGTPAEQPTTQVNDTFAVFEDTLEPYLETEWVEWAQAVLEIESEHGVAARKSPVVYGFATRDAGGTPPSELTDISDALRRL